MILSSFSWGFYLGPHTVEDYLAVLAFLPHAILGVSYAETSGNGQWILTHLYRGGGEEDMAHISLSVTVNDSGKPFF